MNFTINFMPFVPLVSRIAFEFAASCDSRFPMTMQIEDIFFSCFRAKHKKNENDLSIIRRRGGSENILFPFWLAFISHGKYFDRTKIFKSCCASVRCSMHGSLCVCARVCERWRLAVPFGRCHFLLRPHCNYTILDTRRSLQSFTLLSCYYSVHRKSFDVVCALFLAPMFLFSFQFFIQNS